ncbi:MAG: SMP-30/gluconolactonase/LRE family protein [Armatimonadota bacterium]
MPRIARRAAIALIAIPAVAAGLGAALPAAPSAAAGSLRLEQPNGVAVDDDGALYVTDLGTHRLLKLERGGLLAVAAGTGEGGFGGDGGPAVKARLHAPHDVALDAGGSLFVADSYNHRIRRIDRRGVIATVAGTGRDGYSGDGGPAVRATLNSPQGLAVDSDGTLYIADTYNHVVRRVDPQGRISTFAGTEAGLAGDGGPAVRAQISLPTGVAVAPDGSVYISDSGNNRVRRVKPDGTMETVAGTGPGSGTAGAGFAGDGGPAEKAKLFAAADVEVGPSLDLFIADTGNHRLRRVSHGVIETIAGNGTAAASGDGGAAAAASLYAPQKIALGPDGSLYVADRPGRRVRRIDPTGRIETVIGPEGPRNRAEGNGR